MVFSMISSCPSGGSRCSRCRAPTAPLSRRDCTIHLAAATRCFQWFCGSTAEGTRSRRRAIRMAPRLPPSWPRWWPRRPRLLSVECRQDPLTRPHASSHPTGCVAQRRVPPRSRAPVSGGTSRRCHRARVHLRRESRGVDRRRLVGYPRRGGVCRRRRRRRRRRGRRAARGRCALAVPRRAVSRPARQFCLLCRQQRYDYCSGGVAEVELERLLPFRACGCLRSRADTSRLHILRTAAPAPSAPRQTPSPTASSCSPGSRSQTCSAHPPTRLPSSSPPPPTRSALRAPRTPRRVASPRHLSLIRPRLRLYLASMSSRRRFGRQASWRRISRPRVST